jgi:RNA polymerase sigma-70 factor (ECF subfamily)
MSAAFAVGNLAGVLGVQAEEATLTAELKAGSEEAFALLIAQYHAPVYNLIARVLNDPSDAPDITQDVFIKVFRGIRSFHGDSSLRTWIYRIALREALNQRRWWSRHRGREVTIEPAGDRNESETPLSLKDRLVDGHQSPFEAAATQEIRTRIDAGLREIPEQFRAVVVLRDLEGLSYEEIAEVLGAQLGTVKSRLMRGRALLRERLAGLLAAAQPGSGMASANGAWSVTARKQPAGWQEAG